MTGDDFCKGSNQTGTIRSDKGEDERVEHDLLDDDGSSEVDVGEEFFRHWFGHAHTSMGSGKTREMADMHTDAPIEAHEIGHGGIFEDLSGAGAVLAGVCVIVDHFSGSGVPNDSVE